MRKGKSSPPSFPPSCFLTTRLRVVIPPPPPPPPHLPGGHLFFLLDESVMIPVARLSPFGMLRPNCFFLLFIQIFQSPPPPLFFPYEIFRDFEETTLRRVEIAAFPSFATDFVTTKRGGTFPSFSPSPHFSDGRYPLCLFPLRYLSLFILPLFFFFFPN